MPTTPTYPGVYIEEVPSGVRTIAGVATSITAFIGRAERGPVNEPTLINNFGDYQRLFGGLWRKSTMSYAVRDFFGNGGTQALIVRIHNGAAKAKLALNGKPGGAGKALKLEAANEGAWGKKLKALVNYTTKDAPDAKQFNLTVYEDREGGAREEFLNVSVDADNPRYVARILEQQSLLVRVEKDGGGNWLTTDVHPDDVYADEGSAATATGGGDGDAPGTGDYEGAEADKTGIYALKKADLFNLLCIPPPTHGGDTAQTVWSKALDLCVKERAVLIVDPLVAWGANEATAASAAKAGLAALNLTGVRTRNAALYFPRVHARDPMLDYAEEQYVPCGVVAGVIASTDASRGVWKAPAGVDAALAGVSRLQARLNDPENGQLNPLGINCLRTFPVTGRVIWGARTLRGADQFGDEYKYLPVRRLALFIEESLYRGTQWAVFEPNDEPLWGQLRLNVGTFMHNLFRQGAFQGGSPSDAYLVKCDAETTPQADIDRGIVNVIVGFAPLKPAEFVILKIQQLAKAAEG